MTTNIYPGLFVISDGDNPSLRMVRIVTNVDGDQVIAPYIRDEPSLRRFDLAPTSAKSLTPMRDFGVEILWGRHPHDPQGLSDSIRAHDRMLPAGIRTATYSDGEVRAWSRLSHISVELNMLDLIDRAIHPGAYADLRRDLPPGTDVVEKMTTPAELAKLLMPTIDSHLAPPDDQRYISVAAVKTMIIAELKSEREACAKIARDLEIRLTEYESDIARTYYEAGRDDMSEAIAKAIETRTL